jgi:hypothetical protein
MKADQNLLASLLAVAEAAIAVLCLSGARTAEAPVAKQVVSVLIVSHPG